MSGEGQELRTVVGARADAMPSNASFAGIFLPFDQHVARAQSTKLNSVNAQSSFDAVVIQGGSKERMARKGFQRGSRDGYLGEDGLGRIRRVENAELL